MNAKCLLLIALLGSPFTHAAWDYALRADEEPDQKAWEEGATFAWSRSGGQTTAIIDGVAGLEYASCPPGTTELVCATRSSNAFLGGYWHRDTGAGKPRNDRGASATFGQDFRPSRGGGAVWSWGWSGQVKAGKTLKTRDVGGALERYDVSGDRQMAKAILRYQPAMGGTPSLTRIPVAVLGIVDVGAYADRVRGSGIDTVDGRLTGTQMRLTILVAPRGDPALVITPEEGMRVTPLFSFTAQVQRDLHSTGGRLEETRRLYRGAVTLHFAKPGRGIPSLALVRTVGADILTGRPRDAVTELAISLKF